MKDVASPGARVTARTFHRVAPFAIGVSIICGCGGCGEPEAVDSRYTLAWSSDFSRITVDYEVRGDDGKEAVAKWIDDHGVRPPRGRARHAMMPRYRLAWESETERISYSLIERVPESRCGKRGHRVWVENIPANALERLREIFKEHGRAVSSRRGQEHGGG